MCPPEANDNPTAAERDSLISDKNLTGSQVVAADAPPADWMRPYRVHTVESYETSDGKVWHNKYAAIRHQALIDLDRYLESKYVPVSMRAEATVLMSEFYDMFAHVAHIMLQARNTERREKIDK